MTKRPNPLSTPPDLKRWLPMAVFGLVAMLAGVVLPQMLPSATAMPETTPKTGAEPQDPWAYNPPPLTEGPDVRAMLLRLGVGTVVVVALCVGTLWLGKRWLQVAPTPAAGERQLGVLETLALSNRCCVLLIRAGTHQLLAGVDSSGLKALVPLVEPFEQALNDAQAGEAAGSSANPPAPEGRM